MSEGKQLIISIGREFGSGGHEIAEQIANDLSLPLYDYNLMRVIAEEKELSDSKTLEVTPSVSTLMPAFLASLFL